jgi:hypothetical protein
MGSKIRSPETRKPKEVRKPNADLRVERAVPREPVTPKTVLLNREAAR